jgi:hypothetical protein
MSTNNTHDALQGWTSSPDGRGSLDILWTCIATIFLSTWSAICLNVPEPGDTWWTHLKRKAWITFISVMGPEYLLGFALGEWQSAQVSVARFKELRQDDKWTLKHAFFADMGGFVLQTSDDVSFFLDTKHILWLLEHQVISTAEFEKSFILDSKTIDDRNKSDTFIRVIAVGQALWFCVNIVARGVQGLAVTTLEITAVGIIVDSILVYYFWKDKPADVESMEIVKVKMTLSEIILLEEDRAVRTRPYFRTPLDFASREIWSFNLIYHYLMNILKGMRRHHWQKRMEKSIGRRSDNDVLPLTGVAFVIAVLAAMAFEGTNFIAWNFHFPTPIERLLWRISSCGLVAISVVGVASVELFYSDRRIKAMQETVQKRRKALEDRCLPGEEAKWKDRLVYKFRVLAMKIRNNSPDNDPNLDVSLGFAFLGVPLFAVYTIFRVYILLEDVIAFRALPADAYTTVRWWTFFPHIS